MAKNLSEEMLREYMLSPNMRPMEVSTGTLVIE